MAHSSLRPLLLLLEHAQEQRDQALAQRQRADAQLLQARQQQAQLDDYRRDCDARWQGEFRQGVAVSLLQCYHEFAGRLQTAMQMQEQQVGRLEQEGASAGAALMAAELKLASVRKLLERRQLALSQRAERAEQKQMDEMAARAGQHLGRGAGSLHSD
jgi:flagellar FliJ protein